MRMLRLLLTVALPVFAACARHPARSYAAPAQNVSNPLAYVMWAASDRGYRASQRGVDETSMKFERGYGRGPRPPADSFCRALGRSGLVISSSPPGPPRRFGSPSWVLMRRVKRLGRARMRWATLRPSSPGVLRRAAEQSEFLRGSDCQKVTVSRVMGAEACMPGMRYRSARFAHWPACALLPQPNTQGAGMRYAQPSGRRTGEIAA